MKTDISRMSVQQLLDLSRTKGADLPLIQARLKALGCGDAVLVGWEDLHGGVIRTFETGITAIKTTRLSSAGVTTTGLSRMP